MENWGRPFLKDIAQIDPSNVLSAFLGGVIFNASNILLSASMSIAGMAVAFPVGVGLALVLGVFINYFSAPKGDPDMLFIGVALIIAAIICNGIAAGRNSKAQKNPNAKKGIILSVVAGVLMSFFYRFVAASMDMDNFEYPAAGMATPYTAFVIFAVGIFVSNFLFNTYAMKRPFTGEPTSYRQYFDSKLSIHFVGIFGRTCLGPGHDFQLYRCR